jgi:hypothetical protein
LQNINENIMAGLFLVLFLFYNQLMIYQDKIMKRNSIAVSKSII